MSSDLFGLVLGLDKNGASPKKIGPNACFYTGIAGEVAFAFDSRANKWVLGVVVNRFNDPSAGSPTETLLRLLLPLGGRV